MFLTLHPKIFKLSLIENNMNKMYYPQLENYLKKCETKEVVDWFDLPKTTYLEFDNKKITTIRKIISEFGKDRNINNRITGIRTSIGGRILKIKFPINLNQKEYIGLYALMISEGSIRTEFSLNVPEEEFHKIFEENIKKLISKDIIIKKDLNHNFDRTRAPSIIRYLIPIRNHLPSVLFRNKEFAKEYLRIVFEAEGCPIFSLKKSKKYIKLSRNSNISELFNENDLPKEKRIFITEIKEKFNKQYQKIIENPDELILGEHLLLKHAFNIESSLKLECIRLNKIGNRKGKISVKWVLYIYGGEDIKKFNEEIGFISENKKRICKEMLEKIPSRKKQYFALGIMKKHQIKGIFAVKDFNKEMKRLGYISPGKFIWDYWKNKKIIEKISRGKYKLLID